MRVLFEFTAHLLLTLFTLLKPGGVKTIASENIILRQQLIVVQRKRKRAPNLSTSDRFIFGFLCSLISPNRLRKIAIIVKPESRGAGYPGSHRVEGSGYPLPTPTERSVRISRTTLFRG